MNNFQRATLYTVTRFYSFDGSYFDIPVSEIPLANNRYDTNRLFGLLSAGILLIALLK